MFSLAGVLVNMVMLFLTSLAPLPSYVRPTIDVQDTPEKPVISLRVLPALDTCFTSAPVLARGIGHILDVNPLIAASGVVLKHGVDRPRGRRRDQGVENGNMDGCTWARPSMWIYRGSDQPRLRVRTSHSFLLLFVRRESDT